MHDGLGAILATARLQIQKIQSEINVLHKMDLFNKAEELVTMASKEVRRIAHDMMPEDLVRSGLVETLKKLINDINNSNDSTISYYSADVDEDNLTDVQKVNIYRIVQELLQNAINHSDAKNILIQLTQEENNINLTYEDDGQGFNITTLKDIEGIGLKNLKFRADFINGDLNIDSKKGGPTIIELNLPL